MVNVTNMDLISLMSDEEISSRIISLEEAKKNSKNSKFFEVEISYFQREQILRQSRKYKQ
jgi:hypothetical protein